MVKNAIILYKESFFQFLRKFYLNVETIELNNIKKTN